MSEKLRVEKYLFAFFLIACFFYYLFWSVSKGFNFGPDEYGRYILPLYIYKYGVLPDGFVEEIRIPYWGFSYAYYPTFLGPVLSALFMKIMSFFTVDEFWIVVAARFTSVVFGTLTVYFVYKIGGMLFKREYKWFMTVFLAMIPQYTFLTSYVNNDIICICGSAMIIYSWVSGMSDKWNVKNSVLLALGIVVCALSYFNSYGWILMSVFVCLTSFIMKINNNTSFKTMFKLAGIVCVVVLVGVSYFFVRNALLYNGDFLGMKTLTEASELYAREDLKPSMRNTPEHMGVSLLHMLLNMGWIKYTYKSFIGNFGYVNVPCPRWIYVFYLNIIFIALLGIAYAFIKWVFSERKKFGLRCILHTALALGSVIVISLSIYYSYFTDYQAQGRYCYPMIVALAYFIAYGFSYMPVLEQHDSVKRKIIYFLSVVLAAVNIWCCMNVFLPA